jgi:secreted trypsin-like serine protease
MNALARVVVGALSASVLSCAEGAGGDELATRSQSIIDGEASGAEQDGVLLLRAQLDDGSELLCSSSLVAPNLLITAQHCVSYLTDGPFSCTVRGELVDNPGGGGRLGLHLPADSIEIYGRKTPRKMPLAHGVRIISTLSPSVCDNDLAFVVLDDLLELPLVPLRLGRSAEADETAVLVGYGLRQSDLAIDYRTQPRQQKRDLQIAAVGPDSLADGVATTVPPRSVILEGPSGCVGDSGGPLLSQATGALLGVYSLLESSSCASPSAHHQLVHVPPFQTLIDEAFAAAGAEPLLEPEPTGEAGAAAAGAAGAGSTSGGAADVPAATAGAAGDDVTAVRRSPKHSSCSMAPATQYPDTNVGALATLAVLGLWLRRARKSANN